MLEVKTLKNKKLKKIGLKERSLIVIVWFCCGFALKWPLRKSFTGVAPDSKFQSLYQSFNSKSEVLPNSFCIVTSSYPALDFSALLVQIFDSKLLNQT